MKAKVIASVLNLRKPFVRGEIIKTLPAGEVVEVEEFGWYGVKCKDGRQGWVWSEYLKKIDGEVEAGAEEAEGDEISEWPWLKIAKGELNTKEVPGSGNNKRILEYLRSTTLGSGDADQDATPWCSAFVNWVLKQAGITPRTNSAWARSWLNWGEETEDPIPGTIVVFSRGATSGHVGFYLDEDDSRIKVLGGNQSDGVTLAWFSKDNFLGYREPAGWQEG